jgi:hypothetical protein
MKEDEIGEACSAHRGDEKCVQISVAKPEGKRPLGRPRLDDNIKMYLRK